MRPPARAIAGNLVYSTEGRVWAVYKVSPLPFAHRSADAKLTVHTRLRGLLMGLPDDAMLMAVCEHLDPWAVAERMLDGVDPGRAPLWGEAVAAEVDRLDRYHLFQRSHWLAFALADSTRRGLTSAIGAVTSSVGAVFGLPPAPVAADDIEARARQAAAVRARLGTVPLRPATPGEIRWLYARAVARGADEPFYDEDWEPRRADESRRGSLHVLAPLTDAVFHEGGRADDENRPRHRRYLRVDTAAGSGYQALLALADMPHEFVFPGGGGEWFAHLEAAPFPVDWCVRLRSVPNAEAQVRARRQHRQLIGQLDEYEGEVTGAPSSLAEALAAVDDERAALAANPSERECQATVIFATWADNLVDLEEQAATLQAMFQPADYGLGRPTGGQLGLFRSMLPGTEPASVCRDYTQFLLARDLAAGTPFTGSDIGDPSGMLLGASLDAGVFAPVLFDPAYGPTINRSASLGITGALGSGKSYLAKLLCWATVARGGQVVTLDRTASAEYVSFAEVVPGRAQVVQLTVDAAISLDPLRVFSGEDRRRITLGFCSLLAGAPARSLEAAALAEAVDAVAELPEARLPDVIDQLQRIAERPGKHDPDAAAAARKLAHFSRLGVAQLAFGPGPALALDADFVVFHAPGLALADRDTLLNEHLAAQMLPEQVFGQALLYLVAAVARSVIFADRSRFAAALYDEAWALTASPQGHALLLEGVRDGRKHNAACWLASQSPRDLGETELVDLLGARFAFRQARGAAAAAQRFLGLDVDDATGQLLETLAAGQCLLRDVRDRVGLVQVLEAPVRELRDAFDTNPATAHHRLGGTEGGVGGRGNREHLHVVGERGPQHRHTRRRVLERGAGGPAR